MNFGIRWYQGVGEHDYEQVSSQTFDNDLAGLFAHLLAHVGMRYGHDALFSAFVDGRTDTIHWITDDYGFELYWSE